MFTPFVQLLSVYEQESTWTIDQMRELVAIWEKAKTAAQEIADNNLQRREFLGYSGTR